MQWMPAHVGIDENESAHTLAKEARKFNNGKLPCIVTLSNINSVANSRLKNKPLKRKQQIC